MAIRPASLPLSAVRVRTPEAPSALAGVAPFLAAAWNGRRSRPGR